MTDTASIPDLLKIKIAHGHGTETFDPNTLVMTAISKPESLRDLLPTSERSCISNDRGLRYTTNEFSEVLTADEIIRLTMRMLRPDEFFILLAASGPVWEIHDDFYDPETGIALQPKQ
ncbi:hypothetical protein ACOI1H_20015 [Loktanella sp. DJP18]|uniref:hypothetical protein n=1 Tax=Loktanella sp. DJP18 TaxID=3409788 RepID=UPI003BB6A9C6